MYIRNCIVSLCMIQMIQVAGLQVPSIDMSSTNSSSLNVNDNPSNHDDAMMILEHRRVQTLPNEYVAALATKWWNWEFCVNAFHNKSFTPMNSIVPDNVLFLAAYPTYNFADNSNNSTDTACNTSNTITRVGNISGGTLTVFYPLVNMIDTDIEDDSELGICANSTNETLQGRLARAEVTNSYFTSETYIMSLYSNIDTVPVTPTYIYNKETHYFMACPDNVTQTTQAYYTLLGASEGDTCDKEPFQIIDGLDAYPSLGWYGIDIRTWINGETHTYEFGSLTECVTAKYILTAVSTNTTVDNITNVNQNPTDDGDNPTTTSSGGGAGSANVLDVKIFVLLITVFALLV